MQEYTRGSPGVPVVCVGVILVGWFEVNTLLSESLKDILLFNLLTQLVEFEQRIDLIVISMCLDDL